MSDHVTPTERLAPREVRYRATLDHIPLPAFVYDLETLRFLDVNRAAVELYGWSREEFLQKRITDIRPPEDLPRLKEAIGSLDERPRHSGVWRHRTRSGAELEMDIVSQAAELDGRKGRLIIARDVTEQRRLERALRESEERFRAAFQTVPDAMAIGRVEDGVNVAVNQNYCRMSGWPSEEVIGKSSLDLGVWADPGQRASFFLSLLADGSVQKREVRFARRDGSCFDVSLSARLFTAGGRSFYLASARDITERKQAEQLQNAIYRIADSTNSSASLQQLLASVHQIVGELMPAPNFYIALHDRARDVIEFPYYVDERMDCAPSPRKPARGLTEYVLRTGKPVILDPAGLQALADQGEVVRAAAAATSWIGVPLRTPDRILGVLAAQCYSDEFRYQPSHTELLQFVSTQVARAIERKQSEEALRESEQRFRALIRNSSDGIVVLTPEGNTLFASASVEGMVGRDLVGLNIFDFVHPEDRARAESSFKALLGVPDTKMPISARLRHADGSWREMESVVANRLTDPAVRGVVSNFRDVTERKQMEARLMMADRMVSVGTLAAGVAHEINNPLAYVVANLEFLAGRAAGLPPDLADAVREAQAGADRVKTIVRELKTFSRGDDAQHGAVELHEVLEASVNLAWNEVRHRARLVRDYGRGLPQVVGNESRLGQVFLNLLINAAQAIPEGQAAQHQIRITTRAAGEHVVIDFADTGTGIPPEHLGRLFDPFFTTKPVGVGTGLGLFICQNIVQGLGGRIDIESAPGRGTTVHVALRTSAAAAPAPRPPPATAAPDGVKGASRGRVLVIDDEPLIGTALARVLSRQHDVSSETSAQAALTRLRKGEVFDVIFCDLMMPEMTGIAFYERLQAEAPALASAMVFMTGGAFTQAARDFLDRIPNARLDKPLDLPKARALVAERVRQR